MIAYFIWVWCTWWKKWSEVGLRCLIVQRDVLVIGSVDKVLSGKMYNRTVYVHKLVYEGMHRF